MSTVRSRKLKIALASLHWFRAAVTPSYMRLTDSKYALSLGLANWLSRRCQGIPGSSSALKSVNLWELPLPACKHQGGKAVQRSNAGPYTLASAAIHSNSFAHRLFIMAKIPGFTYGLFACMIQWARNPVGPNRWFFDDFIGWISREIYHFAEVTGFCGRVRIFGVILRRGWVKSPPLKGHFAHVAGGALAYVWPACKNGRVQG